MRDKTYFISDLHLGAGYIADTYSHQRRIAAWLRSIAPTARRLFLLGDVIDYWYEYRDVVPRGFVRFLGALAELADSGVEITWLKGNHDIWIFDYLPSELGINVADGIITRDLDGKTFVMEHGDGVGEVRGGYRLMRRIFRNRVCQRLYSDIHPRWTVGFAHRWSTHSRATSSYISPSVLPDTDPLVVFANDYLRSGHHADYFIFGHRHTPAERRVGPDGCATLMVLGDAFSHFNYAVWDGNTLRMETIPEQNNYI